MFTGIVDHVGQIQHIRPSGLDKAVSITSNFPDLKLGESILVNGVCLTVSHRNTIAFTVDISPETLRVSNLDDLTEGQGVNLERALRVGDRFGGHYVTGHVDTTARTVRVQNHGKYLELTLSVPGPFCHRYIHKKGSISVNGVSLTVNELALNRDEFSVLLVPHTLERTNLRSTTTRLNIEFDWMAKVVLKDFDETLKANLNLRLDEKVDAELIQLRRLGESSLGNSPSLKSRHDSNPQCDKWVEDI